MDNAKPQQVTQAELLLANGFIAIPPAPADGAGGPVDALYLGTVLSNLAYYGFIPSSGALAALQALPSEGIAEFWRSVEPALKRVTGADRQMDRHVVYKNFPAEVLEMSQARYWVQQVCIYLGVPAGLFAAEEAEREPMEEVRRLKVLAPATRDTARDLYAKLLALPARWTDQQRDHAFSLYRFLREDTIDLGEVGFRENGIVLAAEAFQTAGDTFKTTSATDVLRLATALSGGDPGLRGYRVPFRRFSRGERRRLLEALDRCGHLVEDFFLRPEPWKRLLSRLHPGDFAVRQVSSAYDRLYRGDFTSFAGTVEHGLRQREPAVLDILASRPGEFMRRLHKAYAVFGTPAFTRFAAVAGALTTGQLLKLDGYLATINGRARLMYPPRGNWGKAQVAENSKVKIAEADLAALRSAISGIVSARLAALFPAGFDVDPAAALVRIQGNDQKLAAYGRGTVFPIPAGITFLRSASYWASKGHGPVWYDNGWNFFGEGWTPMGAICWSSTATLEGACVFSGDPVNSQDLEGRACQMIDLYIDKLAESGVRYAVWNVLAYGRVPFGDAQDVLATLQWGEEAEEGKLYEPSRAQMVFPLRGSNLTKYVAYLDTVERKLVYLDAGLYGKVWGADANCERLAENIPAFLEHVAALPTVADLFRHAPRGSIPVAYTDEGKAITGGPAYVFQRRNADSTFEAIDLGGLLDDKGDKGPASDAAPRAVGHPHGLPEPAEPAEPQGRSSVDGLPSARD